MGQIVIIKRDGTQTNQMEQAQAEKYLGNLIEKNRLPNLKQALNDVTSGKGKATSDYRFKSKAVLHASSGNGQSSVTLFYYDFAGSHYIIAMGEHVTSKSYRLVDYGQVSGDFREKSKIELS